MDWLKKNKRKLLLMGALVPGALLWILVGRLFWEQANRASAAISLILLAFQVACFILTIAR